MAKQYPKEFKEDAVRYYLEYNELGLFECAKNLGISKNALTVWRDNALYKDGEVLLEVAEIFKVMKQKKMPV